MARGGTDNPINRVLARLEAIEKPQAPLGGGPGQTGSDLGAGRSALGTSQICAKGIQFRRVSRKRMTAEVTNRWSTRSTRYWVARLAATARTRCGLKPRGTCQAATGRLYSTPKNHGRPLKSGRIHPPVSSWQRYKRKITSV